MDRRKPVVAGYAAASTDTLHMIQKLAYDGGRQILYSHPIDGAAALFVGKRKKQRQCVTILACVFRETVRPLTTRSSRKRPTHRPINSLSFPSCSPIRHSWQTARR